MSENRKWICTTCSTENEGHFCTNCGAAKPQDAREYVEKTTIPEVKVTNEKKNHRISGLAQLALCGLLGLGCGASGSYIVLKNANVGKTIIYQQVASSPSNASSTDTGNAVMNVAAKASPSVVEIKTEAKGTEYGIFGSSYTAQTAGSGVVISEDGYIITNNHVVEGATTINVTSYDGKEYPATLIGTDARSDIAVIKVENAGLTPATIGDSSLVQLGQTAIVIGNPLGTLGGSVTDGIISATDRELTINNQTMNLLQTNAAINSGNSGGGLFDDQGCLIGIVNAKDSGFTSSGATIEGLGFAIPINDAMNVAEQLIQSGYVTDRATIGVSLQTLTQDTAQYKAGLYVASVMEGSGAKAAGVQPYDRIIAADGTEVSSYPELDKILRTKKVGDTLVLTVVREGNQIDLTITLTAPLQNSVQG